MPLRVRAGDALASRAWGDLNSRGGVACSSASAGSGDGSGVTSLATLCLRSTHDRVSCGTVLCDHNSSVFPAAAWPTQHVQTRLHTELQQAMSK